MSVFLDKPCHCYDPAAWVCGTKSTRNTCENRFYVQAWTQWFDRDDASGTGDWELIADIRKENPGKLCSNPRDIEAVTLSGLSVSKAGENIFRNDLKSGFVCRNSDQPDGLCHDYKVRFSCEPDSCDNVCWTKWYNRDRPSGTGDWELLSDLIKENPGRRICVEPVYIEAATVDGEIPAIKTGESFYA
ncbi:hypothetical protein AMECASPLE_016869 [Ameca splendens]|uniref:WxxW domain-containing protein n=1 Tax=Ameca splendens TaxID=208324 RepID=A0ABV0XFC5_9TELE